MRGASSTPPRRRRRRRPTGSEEKAEELESHRGDWPPGRRQAALRRNRCSGMEPRSLPSHSRSRATSTVLGTRSRRLKVHQVVLDNLRFPRSGCGRSSPDPPSRGAPAGPPLPSSAAAANPRAEPQDEAADRRSRLDLSAREFSRATLPTVVDRGCATRGSHSTSRENRKRRCAIVSLSSAPSSRSSYSSKTA